MMHTGKICNNYKDSVDEQNNQLVIQCELNLNFQTFWR